MTRRHGGGATPSFAGTTAVAGNLSARTEHVRG
jgi:hypothetical protein